MAQKNKQNVAGARLRHFIAEALELRESNQKVLPPGLAPPVWPAWPYLEGSNVLGSKVTKELGSPEQSKREVEWRLKRLPYPYPAGNKKNRTFHKHLQSLGVLDLILSPLVLWEIRRVWWFQRFYGHEVSARRERRSDYGYGVEFHRKLMFECSSHLHRIEALMKKYAVRGKWIEVYRKAILTELLREAAICYPQLLRWRTLRWPKPALQIRPRSFAVDMQLTLYDEIETAFARRKIIKHKLARQLTALVCSTHEDISKWKLNPTPEQIRSNIRDRKSS
jgi:hypothetical protein